MSYRLIALDLDGTLIDANHRLSPGSATAIAACQARGLRVVLATGRSFASAAPYIDALGLQPPYITHNGAVIGDPSTGDVTLSATMNQDQLAHVLTLLTEHRIPHVVIGATAIYAAPGTPHLELLEEYGEPPVVFCPSDELSATPQPLKVLAFLEAGAHEQTLTAAVGPQVVTIRSGACFFEFMPPGVSKGAALGELMRRYGVAADEVLAIGDGDNDLSMFAVAGMSIAMGNAPPHVQAQARERTARCEEGGVAEALRRFVLGEMFG